MSSTNATPTLATLQDDIATLKRDLSGLVDHLRAGTASNAETAMAQMTSEAQRLYGTVSAESTRTAKALGKQMERHPFRTLLITAAVAYLGGRFLVR